MTTPIITGNQASASGKEEGELSASDDDVQPMQQTSTRAPLSDHVFAPSANTNIPRPRQAGNAGPLIKPAVAATPSKAAIPVGRVVKKPAVSTTPIHGKKLPLRGDDNNLVIDFSDDDSGGSESDSKGRKQIQPKGTVSGNRKPSTLLQGKLKGPFQIDNRAVTKKAAPSTSTFTHAATSKVSNLGLPKGFRKNSHTFERKVSKDTQRPEQILDPNSSKLQELELRQQIAQRELDQKLKALQTKKDAVDPKVSQTRSLVMVSGNGKQLEPSEPAKKRLKVSGNDTSQPVIDNRVPASTAAPMKAPAIGKSLLSGMNANASCKHIGINSGETATPVVSQHIVQGNTSSIVLQKSGSKANHFEGVRCTQPDLPVQLTSRELETMKYVDSNLSSDQLPKIVNGNHQPSLDNSVFWNIPGNTSAPGHSQLDMQYLTNLEESLDRDLEEAQERKRLCEIEERNALKVYRKAQRSLIEANAKCAELYSKREALSAHYGSLIVRDTRLLWPSVHHEHPETGLRFLSNSAENIDLATQTDIPQHTQLETNHIHNNEYGGIHSLHRPHSGQSLGSEPCSDRDASNSEGLPCSDKQTASRLCSPSSDAHILAEGEPFPVDHESTLGHQPETLEQTLGNQSSLLIEASLRSKLFERLGMREESRGGTGANAETVIEREDESNVASERTKRDGSSPVSEKNHHSDCKEPDAYKLQGSPSEPPVERSTINENFGSSVDMESHDTSPDDDLLLSVASAGPLFRSTINHLKVPGSSITTLGTESTLENKSYSLYSDVRQRSSLTRTPVCERKIDLYTPNLKMDPFRPLCMYELRGRCNNDECSWQHFKDFADDSLNPSQNSPPDGNAASSLHEKQLYSSRGSQDFDVVRSPTYLVCLDTMKVDSRSYESLLAQRHGQIWGKHFSVCLASSNLLYKNIPARENEGRIEVLGNPRTHSSYLRIKHSLMNLLNQGSDAAVESVEMALTIFRREIDHSEGLIQALSVLSRGLEGDPASEILWIVYLLIYYSHGRSDGKDMLSLGVNMCSGSYVIWLMYINSREQLNDQLSAYDAALSALCNHAPGSIDRDHASACILDLSLQMFNLMCISGNVSKAIQRISKLQAPAAVSEDPDFSMMSQILTCLTYSDKCVFWICCVYLVIYRKLPDSVVQRFEMEKELLEIVWPSVDLVGDLKQMALSLFDKGMRSEERCVSDGSSENGIEERTAGLFALNHALFMIAVDELEKCKDIVKASIELYPACLELKLLAARVKRNESSSGFEDLLKQEPKDASGRQWIWNQYAEYALQKGSNDTARELTSRWYSSVWDVSSCKKKTALTNKETEEEGGSAASDQVDEMFGYLNLSLHNLLQSNWTGACTAIDQALKAAAPDHFMHCLREHAVFQLINSLQATGEFPINLQLRLLNSYLDQASSLPVKEPLSWKFISNSAEKARVRKLVSNLLAPVSSELFVVNTVLEAWYGPSLVPEKLSKQKELVDFVETILGLVPCNYPLALSVSKLLRKEEDSGSSGIHFWSGLNLVSTVSCAMPVAPEYIWVEAGEILSNINGFKTKAERFLCKAVSVYPMSVKLWRCYGSVARSIEEKRGVRIEEESRKKGITLLD